MACRYTLLLRYDNNKFYLAPRFSIDVVETSGDFETLTDQSGCAGCGQPKDRTWHFKAHFEGGCSLQSAYALYNAMQAFLNQACDPTKDLIVSRRVCDETALEYKVSKAQVKMIDVINQYLKQRVLTMDITLELTAWVQTGEGAVIVG